MQNIFKIVVLISILGFYLPAQALTNQQQTYQQLVTAFVAKDHKTVAKLAKKLKGYILYPYVEYYLVNNFKYANKAKINKFLKKYGNKAIAVRLKSKWLDWLIANKHYHSASQYSGPRYAYNTRCNILYAKIKLGESVDYFSNKDLWLHGRSRPDACDPVFKYWKNNQSIGAYNYSLRTKLALKKGNLTFAKKLAIKANKPTQAKVWLAVQKRRAIFKAKDFPANGYQLLNRLPKSIVDDNVRAWKVRQFIHNADWGKVLREIKKMPLRQRLEDIWLYWRARSLARLGNRIRAIELYRDLAQKANYYGFLSADRLSLPYKICNEKRRINASQILNKFKPLKLAFELHKLNSKIFATMEWNSAVRRMNRQQKIDAAILAGQYGWHSKAIFTLGLLREFKHYKLRFPIKWQTTVLKHAEKHNLSPAFIYGIMRTESSMKPNAQSRVGAIGLMQLMPKTAKLVSKNYNLPRHHKKALFEPKNNIAFGSAYLNKMAKNWDDQFILITASYNAGPRKVKEWVNELPVEADRFIESIPYDETRKYVTRVLDYTTMYNWRMYGSVKRVGYRISNVNSSKPFISSNTVYTAVVCSN